jgi:cysteine desulfuration protein SufE
LRIREAEAYKPPMSERRPATGPGTISDIVEDFDLLDEWEDRYRYVIELGRELSPLPESARTDANKVRGCASQVWLVTHVDRTGRAPVLTFEGDSDAHIVRGLIAILLRLFSGRTAAEILATDAHGLLERLGLNQQLTPQRSNGLASMVARIRRDAEAVATQIG